MTELEKTLLAIASEETGGDVDDGLREKIHLILDESDMENDDAVPPWLLQFFTGLLERQTVPVTELPATAEDQGLVWEFFNCLQDISVFDCYDFGEWVRVRLPRLGMLGIISIEHSYYRVVPLAEVEGDQGDLADAKNLVRPS